MNNKEYHHHHHVNSNERMVKIFIVSIVLNLLFVLIEAFVGWGYDSLSLLSDAGHNLSDVLRLILSFWAFKMAEHQAHKRFTYECEEVNMI